MKVADVPTIQLDSLRLEPDFIKLDIEGCEVKALKGAEQTILKHKPKMVIEVNHEALRRQGSYPGEIFGWLKDHGYQWSIMQENMGRTDPMYDILCLPVPVTYEKNQNQIRDDKRQKIRSILQSEAEAQESEEVESNAKKSSKTSTSHGSQERQDSQAEQMRDLPEANDSKATSRTSSQPRNPADGRVDMPGLPSGSASTISGGQTPILSVGQHVIALVNYANQGTDQLKYLRKLLRKYGISRKKKTNTRAK
jgi:hypothetical protein